MGTVATLTTTNENNEWHHDEEDDDTTTLGAQTTNVTHQPYATEN